MKWRKLEFKDFVTLQRGFDLPQTRMREGNVPVLGSNCIIGFHNEAKVLPPGVVTGRSGTLGKVQFVDQPYWPHNTALWVRDFKGNEPKYVYYKLKTLNLDRFSSGASVPTLNRHNLDNLSIEVPPYQRQRAISDVLSAYDDLIENNRQRMALLEETARLIYREWFVRLRFPGHEHTRITNGMPEGWERKRLGEMAYITMGQSPESTYYNEHGEGLPFHQGVTDFGDRFVSHRIYCTALNRIAEAGDILCSVRAPVGRLNVTLDRIVIGRGLAALRSKTENQSFLFQQLRAHFFKEDLIGSGAIFVSVTRKEFESQELLDPPDRLKRVSEDAIVPCDEQLRALHLQNQKLRAARDLLLPRLMSGKIEVSAKAISEESYE
jgi:type I restriction enzyme S subunit